MREEQPIVLVLPRFTPWMKRLAILVGALWGLQLLLGLVAPELGRMPRFWLSLIPARVLPGLELWRLVTYPWFEDPTSFSAVWTILAFWLIGSPVERAHGIRRIVELLIAGVLGGALVAVAASRLSLELYTDAAMGMAAFSSALLAALGFLYADQPVSFFGIGPMKGKHLVLALGGLTVLLAVTSRSAGGATSVGGLLGGAAWMWWVTRGRKHTRKGAGAREAGRGKASGSRFRVVPGGRQGDDKHWLN